MDKERLNEDKAVGNYLYTLKASDRDGDCIDFSIKEGDSHFKIYNQTCTEATVSLKIELDYETADKHDVTWTLDDGHNSIMETAIKIYVLDVNDNAPEFSINPYFISLKEDEDIMTTILALSVTDADSGTNGEFTLNLINPNEFEDMFYLEVSTPDRAYIILNRTLDFEAIQDLLYLVVTAVDHGTGPLTGTTTVYIAQYTLPMFTRPYYFGHVAENQPLDTSVLEISAIDGGQPLQFSIPDINSDFWVETVFSPGGYQKGIIRTAKDFDRESLSEDEATIVFTVVAKEIDNFNQSSSASTSNVTIIVTIEDVNDVIPAFDSQSYIGLIHSDSQQHESVESIEIEVTDLDMFDNGRFGLEMVGDSEAMHTFYLTPEKALNKAYTVIRVQSNLYLGFEKNQKFDFMVVAKETHSVEKFSSTVNVTVMVKEMGVEKPFRKSSDTLLIVVITVLSSAVVLLAVGSILLCFKRISARMTNYKFLYFNVRGRGEIIRLVFAAADVEYEDVRIDREKWRTELKDSK
ncbi:cadherin-related family member 1-like [Glandiceps talaboti]